MVKHWTPDEDAELLRLRRAGITFTEITGYFPGRSIHSCNNRWHYLKLTPEQKKIRGMNDGRLRSNGYSGTDRVLPSPPIIAP